MEIVKQPHVQLGIYLTVLFFTTVISKFNSRIVIEYGTNSLLIWILIATLAGISTEYSWWYYVYLFASLLIGYLLLWGCFYISDKFGEPYRGEGGLYVLTPVMLAGLLLTISLLSKLVWHFLTVPN